MHAHAPLSCMRPAALGPRATVPCILPDAKQDALELVSLDKPNPTGSAQQGGEVPRYPRFYQRQHIPHCTTTLFRARCAKPPPPRAACLCLQPQSSTHPVTPWPAACCDTNPPALASPLLSHVLMLVVFFQELLGLLRVKPGSGASKNSWMCLSSHSLRGRQGRKAGVDEKVQQGWMGN